MSRLPLLLLLTLLAIPARADEALWQQLKTGKNMVVLLRHAAVSGSRPLHWDASGACRDEQMLTPQGKTDAERIGRLFAERGIKPAAVISSPMCRCRDTARLAFGTEATTAPELRETESADAARASAFERTAQSLIAARLGAAPVIFVSHRPNINQLTMELLATGEMLVGSANEKGEIEVLGRLTLPH